MLLYNLLVYIYILVKETSLYIYACVYVRINENIKEGNGYIVKLYINDNLLLLLFILIKLMLFASFDYY